MSANNERDNIKYKGLADTNAKITRNVTDMKGNKEQQNNAKEVMKCKNSKTGIFNKFKQEKEL